MPERNRNKTGAASKKLSRSYVSLRPVRRLEEWEKQKEKTDDQDGSASGTPKADSRDPSRALRQHAGRHGVEEDITRGRNNGPNYIFVNPPTPGRNPISKEEDRLASPVVESPVLGNESNCTPGPTVEESSQLRDHTDRAPERSVAEGASTCRNMRASDARRGEASHGQEGATHARQPPVGGGSDRGQETDAASEPLAAEASSSRNVTNCTSQPPICIASKGRNDCVRGPPSRAVNSSQARNCAHHAPEARVGEHRVGREDENSASPPEVGDNSNLQDGGEGVRQSPISKTGREIETPDRSPGSSAEQRTPRQAEIFQGEGDANETPETTLREASEGREGTEASHITSAGYHKKARIGSGDSPESLAEEAPSEEDRRNERTDETGTGEEGTGNAADSEAAVERNELPNRRDTANEPSAFGPPEVDTNFGDNNDGFLLPLPPVQMRQNDVSELRISFKFSFGELTPILANRDSQFLDIGNGIPRVRSNAMLMWRDDGCSEVLKGQLDKRAMNDNSMIFGVRYPDGTSLPFVVVRGAILLSNADTDVIGFIARHKSTWNGDYGREVVYLSLELRSYCGLVERAKEKIAETNPALIVEEDDMARFGGRAYVRCRLKETQKSFTWNGSQCFERPLGEMIRGVKENVEGDCLLLVRAVKDGTSSVRFRFSCEAFRVCRRWGQVFNDAFDSMADFDFWGGAAQGEPAGGGMRRAGAADGCSVKRRRLNGAS